MILTILNLVVIVGLLYWLQPKSKLKLLYWSGAIFKISCGLFVGWLYWFYVGEGDTLIFHQQASRLQQMAFSDYLNTLFTPTYAVFKGEARNELFTKILSIFYWLNGGNYWVSSVELSLISFTGVWFFIRKVQQHFPPFLIPAAVGFLYFPTPALWTSGVLKDSIIGSAIAILFGVAISYYQSLKVKWNEILLTSIGLLLLFYFKFYLAATIGFLLGLLAWIKLIKNLNLKPRFTISSSLVFISLLIYAMSQVNMNLHFDKLPEAIYKNFEAISNASSNSIRFESLEPSWSGIILNLPNGLATGIFRPWLWEISWMMLLPALEHLLITILIAYHLINFKNIGLNTLSVIALIYCTILATILPLAAPNFGTLIRYEAAYVPLLIMLLLIHPYKQFFLKSSAFV